MSVTEWHIYVVECDKLHCGTLLQVEAFDRAEALSYAETCGWQREFTSDGNTISCPVHSRKST